MTATIDQRVADVVAIIGRDKARPDFIKEEIEGFESQLRQQQLRRSREEQDIKLYGAPESVFGPWNPADKKTAKKIAAAFQKLENKLALQTLENRLAAFYEGKPFDAIPSDDAKSKDKLKAAQLIYRAIRHVRDNSFYEWINQLKDWRKYFETWAGKGEPSVLWGKPFALPKGRQTQEDIRKQGAAAAAARILDSHGLRRAVTPPKQSERKASVFCRVAAAVYGNKRANLYQACRAYNDRAKREAAAEREAVERTARNRRRRGSRQHQGDLQSR